MIELTFNERKDMFSVVRKHMISEHMLLEHMFSKRV